MPTKSTAKSQATRARPASAARSTKRPIDKPKAAPKAARKVTASKVATLAPPPSGHKVDQVIALLRTDSGASLAQLIEATGWQAHSLRGTISGVLRKRLKLNVVCEASVYRIVDGASA